MLISLVSVVTLNSFDQYTICIAITELDSISNELDIEMSYFQVSLAISNLYNLTGDLY